MKIVFVFSTDPIIMNPYIYRLISEGGVEIAGVIEVKGAMIKRKKRSDRYSIMFAFMLIVGPWRTMKYSFISLYRRVFPSTAVRELCESKSIPYYQFNTINTKGCIEVLTELQPDIIFNQSDHIVRQKAIDVPRIGIVNRHGSLLPRYRGQMSPFWQVYRGEKTGGITFHFLDEKLDSGPIIYQEEIPINKNETANSMIQKVFDHAFTGFPKVVEHLSKPDWKDRLIENDSTRATYFRLPMFKDAWRYRMGKGPLKDPDT